MDQRITRSRCPTTKVQVLIDEEEACKTAKAKKATKKAMNAAKRKQKELQRENVTPTPKPTECSRPPVEEDDSVCTKLVYIAQVFMFADTFLWVQPPTSEFAQLEVQVAGQTSRSESAEDPIKRDESDTDQGVYPTERDDSLETYTDQGGYDKEDANGLSPISSGDEPEQNMAIQRKRHPENADTQILLSPNMDAPGLALNADTPVLLSPNADTPVLSIASQRGRTSSVVFPCQRPNSHPSVHSSDLDPGPAHKVRRVHSVDGRPKAKDFRADIQDVISAAITHYRADLSTMNSYPDMVTETNWAKATWKAGCKEKDVDMVPNVNHLCIITARSGHLRGDVKTKAKDAVANVFNFQHTYNPTVIANQRTRVAKLKRDFTYVYRHVFEDAHEMLQSFDQATKDLGILPELQKAIFTGGCVYRKFDAEEGSRSHQNSLSEDAVKKAIKEHQNGVDWSNDEDVDDGGITYFSAPPPARPLNSTQRVAGLRRTRTYSTSLGGGGMRDDGASNTVAASSSLSEPCPGSSSVAPDIKKLEYELTLTRPVR
ncbi:hypothetical protein F5148DRAFT_1379395 [Russula earlei]|uniref:Uncharacterized protein n=1 Tax=Russula earlei TaxID=71964 RepID=A0ACC0TV28_9AGAM|nr:hypothetical protein F5148DRAFT_1379395 [Russula earlei]